MISFSLKQKKADSGNKNVAKALSPILKCLSAKKIFLFDETITCKSNTNK
jgi:hypothetical protein